MSTEQTFIAPSLCGNPRGIYPLFLPFNTSSGAPRCEDCWEKPFVPNRYGRGVMKVDFQAISGVRF
jgi:hypothetical protein